MSGSYITGIYIITSCFPVIFTCGFIILESLPKHFHEKHFMVVGRESLRLSSILSHRNQYAIGFLGCKSRLLPTAVKTQPLATILSHLKQLEWYSHPSATFVPAPFKLWYSYHQQTIILIGAGSERSGMYKIDPLQTRENNLARNL